ncbi:hypothetical protein GYMLUDRAFT_242845 [Collybiopsis luxurians FD-317 M1]|uniref:Uncharacterized protein n=1 Tax=Collybiopsis luxurians FD-317 M1 TaxID=944289 RepID=A0A0D0CZU4_9AGAR|nr:hypothetical protein GYMLUDRAFT_242845 [Collybiopsis luxurians FD-317 M1]
MVLFESGAQVVTAHCVDGSPYAWAPGQNDNAFTLAGRDQIASFTPPIKSVPIPLPDAPIKIKSMKMDVDQELSPSPSHPYSLHLSPTHTTKYHSPGLAPGKHLLEKDSDGSWDNPEFISNLKNKRRKTDQGNDNFEEILEAAGISNSQEPRGKHENQSQGAERGKDKQRCK